MQFFPKVAKCSNVDCNLTVFRNRSDKQLTDKQITTLVTQSKPEVIRGFKSKTGKLFDAALGFDEQYQVMFIFPLKKMSTSLCSTILAYFFIIFDEIDTFEFLIYQICMAEK